MTICRECCGQGKIKISEPTNKVDSKGNIVHEVKVYTCPKCGGSGQQS